MKATVLTWPRRKLPLALGLWLVLLGSSLAQDAGGQPTSQGGSKEPSEMTEQLPKQGTQPDRQHMHAQMEAMHQEMEQELQQRMTALRAHTQTMGGVTDTQQLLTEMKKHQQMTDDLIATMLEQRAKMHARMKEHRQHGHRQKGHPSGAGCGATGQPQSSPSP